MTLLRILPLALMIAAGPVAAADVTLTNAEKTQLRIKCDSSNCRVREKKAGDKWRTIENAQGGSRNFDKLREKYRQAGFQ